MLPFFVVVFPGDARQPDCILLGRMIAASQHSHLPSISFASLKIRHPRKALARSPFPSCIQPHKINNNTRMLFLRSEGAWHTSSVMVRCSVSMPFPQGTGEEEGGGGVG